MKKLRSFKNGAVFCLLLAVSSLVARGELVYGLSQNTLFTFDSQNPGTIGGIRPITGLGTDTLVGIDIRPETGALFGLSSSLTLFTIDPATGFASQVNGTPFGTSTGSSFGFDFNPVPDAVRAVNNAAQNFRVSPSGSLIANDGTLAYAVGDPNFGQDPAIVGVAYANNNPNATTTSLYGIDSTSDTLVLIASPNSGVLGTQGLLGVNTSEKVSFDISGVTGNAYAALTGPNGAVSGFYQIDLASGTATLVGNIGFGATLDGLTVAVVPEPGTWTLLILGLLAFIGYRSIRKPQQV